VSHQHPATKKDLTLISRDQSTDPPAIPHVWRWDSRPWCRGTQSTSPDSLRQLCSTHCRAQASSPQVQNLCLIHPKLPKLHSGGRERGSQVNERLGESGISLAIQRTSFFKEGQGGNPDTPRHTSMHITTIPSTVPKPLMSPLDPGT
jgi:hypothetical protein